jgi:putative membrane protein
LENVVPAILNYLLFVLTAVALVLAFFIIYTKVTPFDEVLLVRQGNRAAALSLGGTLLPSPDLRARTAIIRPSRQP